MPANIIIVDDTPENLTVLRDILTRAGHKVRPVLQGELAIRIARMEPPDLILLDIVMPGLNGYETCERLKADPLTASCPVLFISALDSVNDKVRGFQAGALDYITKPFQVDEVLARVRTHLALHAAQRQLQQQNAQLAEAARLREDMDRLLRHDLRGPLGNLIAFSELVEQATESSQPQVAQHARVMTGAAYALLSMVHGSFDLLKMERGDYVPQAEDFDLSILLRQVLREMTPMAAERRLALVLCTAPPSLPMVRGESLLCRSLFYNLIRNAIEASPQGGCVEVSLGQGDTESHLVASVRNAGEVPGPIRDHFFEKYVTSGKPQGSGLGTYSARLMAHAQGGSIQLDTSEPGHTRLVVKLPAAAAPGQPLALARCTRLLVADDDPAIHAYLAHTLPASLHTISVHDGQQALQALQSQPFDHALIDLHMPGLDGLALAQAWTRPHPARAGERRCTLIALSAHGDAQTHQQCLSAGFDHVLSKPPSMPALLALLGLPPATRAEPLHLDPALQTLMPEFLRTRQVELERLANAMALGQAGKVASLAHKLQGSFAMYGFAKAGQLAASIEKIASTDLRQAALLLADLRHHLATTPIQFV
jgi:two-component system sensor histidine kinase/response regulator